MMSSSSREVSNLMMEATFVVIKYGDDQEALINPCCSTYTFVDWIRKICNCDQGITIDLLDLEGQIRNLPVTSDDYASEYVNGRETYVVIRVEKQGENGPNKYISLLNNLDALNPELLVKLNNLSRPGTRSNKKDKFKKTAVRAVRGNNNQKRPTSSERSSRSRQGK